MSLPNPEPCDAYPVVVTCHDYYGPGKHHFTMYGSPSTLRPTVPQLPDRREIAIAELFAYAVETHCYIRTTAEDWK